jgi:hypothetical protein
MNIFCALDVVEFETTIDKRKKKPVAVNITPASPEIIGENRVEGTIAVVARQQQHNSVINKQTIFRSKTYLSSFLNLILCLMEK